MNELAAMKKQLPDTVDQLVDYVVINEEKLNAVNAAIRAARKAGDINLKELQKQQRELEITTVTAQCRLGELTAEIPKAKNQHSACPSLGQANTKEQTLTDSGLTRQRASEYERMAAHPDVVERIIQEGEHVTKSAVLNAIKEEKREHLRKERERTIEEKISEDHSDQYVDIFTTSKKFRVIYADPPWKYNDRQNVETMGGAEKHYPTMSLNEICSLPVPSADNAVLFIWATSPMLEDAFKVINAWGFKYKSSFVWDKEKHNMGHYNSVRHELLLICTKGSCTPDVKRLFDSVVTVERSEHSKKPDIFREMIDTLYDHGERIELFAREASEKWFVWGNMI